MRRKLVLVHTQGHLGDYLDLSMARSFGPRSTSPPPCGWGPRRRRPTAGWASSSPARGGPP